MSLPVSIECLGEPKQRERPLLSTRTAGQRLQLTSPVYLPNLLGSQSYQGDKLILFHLQPNRL